MPRLPPSLLRQAGLRHPLLPPLLRECRDLDSAQNELRWLKEHASKSISASSTDSPGNSRLRKALISRQLVEYVSRRSKGEPLQYILGTQPFGNLDIICRKGVLVPRPDTETYVTKASSVIRRYLASHVQRSIQDSRPLRVLDLCAGTGCIALLLHSLLRPPLTPTKGPTTQALPPSHEIVGIDVSPKAVKLARTNLQHNLQQGLLHPLAEHEVSFLRADVLRLANPAFSSLATSKSIPTPKTNANAISQAIQTLAFPSSLSSQSIFECDIIISNPPYISPSAYGPGGTTERSVRKYEPKLALVPPVLDPTKLPPSAITSLPGQLETHPGDVFYLPLITLARALNTKLLIMEVGDTAQARRVVRMLYDTFSSEYTRDGRSRNLKVEVWYDDSSGVEGSEMVQIGASEGERCGETGSERRASESDGPSARAVVCFREGWATWRRTNVGDVMGN